MKKLILAAVFVLGFCTSGRAADIYSNDLTSRPFGLSGLKDIAPASGNGFSGFNVFADFGYGQMNNQDFSTAIENLSIQQSGVSTDGVLGGGGVGVGHVFGSGFYLGASTEIQFGDISGKSDRATAIVTIPAYGYHPASVESAPLASSAKVSMDWLGATKLEAGVVLGNNFLAYGHIGLGYGSFDASARNEISAFSGSEVKTGLTYGGGLEYLMADHWTGFVEYSHFDFGDFSVNGLWEGEVPGKLNKLNGDLDLIMCGFRYRF